MFSELVSNIARLYIQISLGIKPNSELLCIILSFILLARCYIYFIIIKQWVTLISAFASTVGSDSFPYLLFSAAEMPTAPWLPVPKTVLFANS